MLHMKIDTGFQLQEKLDEGERAAGEKWLVVSG